eukprot:Opistho-2@29485
MSSGSSAYADSSRRGRSIGVTIGEGGSVDTSVGRLFTSACTAPALTSSSLSLKLASLSSSRSSAAIRTDPPPPNRSARTRGLSPSTSNPSKSSFSKASPRTFVGVECRSVFFATSRVTCGTYPAGVSAAVSFFSRTERSCNPPAGISISSHSSSFIISTLGAAVPRRRTSGIPTVPFGAGDAVDATASFCPPRETPTNCAAGGADTMGAPTIDGTSESVPRPTKGTAFAPTASIDPSLSTATTTSSSSASQSASDSCGTAMPAGVCPLGATTTDSGEMASSSMPQSLSLSPSASFARICSDFATDASATVTTVGVGTTGACATGVISVSVVFGMSFALVGVDAKAEADCAPLVTPDIILACISGVISIGPLRFCALDGVAA